MKINKNSFSSKIYKYVYNVEDWELPNNLCSYFWKLIGAFLIIPLFLISHLIIAVIKRRIKREDLPLGILLLYSLLSLFGMVMVHFTEPTNLFYIFIEIFGITGYIILTMSIIGYVIYRLDKKYKGGNNIVSEYIKAKKNKMCPRIEWVEKEEVENNA